MMKSYAWIILGMAAALVWRPEFCRSEIPAAEREALMALYLDTDGENWSYQTGWMGPPGTECEWSGVACDAERGHIIWLILDFNHLSGPLPPELGDLASLMVLDLEANAISGPLPRAIGELTSLTILNLESNLLTGPVPAELGNLENLRELYLGINRFSGEIPPELGNLNRLKVLDLGANYLEGSIPLTLGKLEDLEKLYLEINHLSGTVPEELAELENLKEIRLHANRFDEQALKPEGAGTEAVRRYQIPEVKAPQLRVPYAPPLIRQVSY